jgi:hypothetical protein
VSSAAFSPDGSRVVTVSNDYTARVWDAVTGKSLTSPLEHQNDLLRELRELKPTVVHFSGHGGARTAGAQGSAWPRCRRCTEVFGEILSAMLLALVTEGSRVTLCQLGQRAYGAHPWVTEGTSPRCPEHGVQLPRGRWG